MELKIILLRLILSAVLGGLIGMERENQNRPAGFRTHILVCVGSAIVMITSDYMFNKYGGPGNVDPTRLGQGVISGIGFLGAGTIIRQGANVKGLTTAASLWAVACIGFTVGVGFYSVAILGSVIIFFTLMSLRKVSELLEKKTSHLTVFVEIENRPGKIAEISSLLGKYDVSIRNIEFLQEIDDEALLKFRLKLPYGLSHQKIIEQVSHIHGIINVEEEAT